jgi:putative endonuclease
MMKTKKQSIGAWGEEEAANYLSSLGYEIIGRNIRTQHGEIDIVAQSGDVIIFVEVRTLTSSRIAHPEETITAKKRMSMLAAAEDNAQLHEIHHWQIDAIAVEGKQTEKPIITHFENVIG